MINNILVIGILVSLAFYEITEISPGGLIVPAYMAFYIDNPRKIVATLALSILIYLVVKIISKYTIIYGRRKFALCILISFVLRFLFIKLYIFETIIGILIPAILAREYERGGIVVTTSSLAMVAIFTKVLAEILHHIGF